MKQVIEFIRFEDKTPGHNEYVLVFPHYISSTYPNEPRHVLMWDNIHQKFIYYTCDGVYAVANYKPVYWVSLPKVYTSENTIIKAWYNFIKPKWHDLVHAYISKLRGLA